MLFQCWECNIITKLIILDVLVWSMFNTVLFTNEHMHTYALTFLDIFICEFINQYVDLGIAADRSWYNITVPIQCVRDDLFISYLITRILFDSLLRLNVYNMAESLCINKFLMTCVVKLLPCLYTLF